GAELLRLRPRACRGCGFRGFRGGLGGRIGSGSQHQLGFGLGLALAAPLPGGGRLGCLFSLGHDRVLLSGVLLPVASPRPPPTGQDTYLSFAEPLKAIQTIFLSFLEAVPCRSKCARSARSSPTRTTLATMTRRSMPSPPRSRNSAGASPSSSMSRW